MKDYKQIKGKLNKHIITYLVYTLLVITLSSMLLNSLNDTRPNSFLGYTIRLVVSGSMEPEININSISIIKTSDINDINTGDIICFRYKQDIVHRVIDKKTNESGMVILNTKGDANELADSIEITEDMLVGKVIYTCNEIAPLISKYTIEPGKVDSVTLSRNIVLYGMLIGIIVLAVWSIISTIYTFISTLFKSRNLNEQLNEYLNDIDELILYRDIIKDLIDNNVENKAETRFEYIGQKLAKIKVLIECKGLHNDIRGFKHGIRKAVFVKRLFKSFDMEDSDIRSKGIHDLITTEINENIGNVEQNNNDNN